VIEVRVDPEQPLRDRVSGQASRVEDLGQLEVKPIAAVHVHALNAWTVARARVAQVGKEQVSVKIKRQKKHVRFASVFFLVT
jgi:hypothetical protein